MQDLRREGIRDVYRPVAGNGHIVAEVHFAWELGAFAYLFAGGKFCNASGPLAVPTEGVGWLDTAPPSEADNRSLILFDRGDEVEVQAGEEGVRFLLVSGKPLEEPVAWYGPIVMNTQQELQQAFEELEKGTFLKAAS